MSCESCIAERFSEMEAYKLAKKSAQEKANAESKPYYILRTPNGYTISDKIEPNAFEAILPDNPM